MEARFSSNEISSSGWTMRLEGPVNVIVAGLLDTGSLPTVAGDLIVVGELVVTVGDPVLMEALLYAGNVCFGAAEATTALPEITDVLASGLKSAPTGTEVTELEPCCKTATAAGNSGLLAAATMAGECVTAIDIGANPPCDGVIMCPMAIGLIIGIPCPMK